MSTLAERLSAALAPRYRLGEEVGAGGMARVFRAEDSMLARPVAVKVLRPELATAVASERFLREARALAAVAHPNVMTIHECGQVDGLRFYVMDLRTGARSLQQCLDEAAHALARRHGLETLSGSDRRTPRRHTRAR